MGHYSLILEKRYQEFCDVYQEKGHLCKTDPGEYGDLQPGSQARALLALGEYAEAARVCRDMMRQEVEESARRGYDARSSIWLIDLAIAYMKQGHYAEAAQAIREAPHTNYQPNRIQAPCLMYYMAVVMEGEDLKRGFGQRRARNRPLRRSGSSGTKSARHSYYRRQRKKPTQSSICGHWFRQSF